MLRKFIIALSALLTALAIHDAHAQVGGGFPPAAPPLAITCNNTGAYCTLPASGLQLGQFAVITVSSGESRTSTVTLTASTQWGWNGCASCGGQVYAWWIYGVWSNSGGVQGIRLAVTTNTGNCNVGSGTAGFGTLASGGSFITPVDISAGNAISATASGGSVYMWGLTGSGGPAALCIAQNVSGATASFFNGGSVWLLQRVL